MDWMQWHCGLPPEVGRQSGADSLFQSRLFGTMGEGACAQAEFPAVGLSSKTVRTTALRTINASRAE
jgi:hypothetical protein